VRIKLAIALLTCSYSFAAFAESGLYLLWGFGSVNTEIKEAGPEFNDDNLGGKISLGYAFNDYLSIEGGYLRSQDVYQKNYSAEVGPTEITYYYTKTVLNTDLLSVSARGTIPLGERFKLFGRVGLASWYESREHQNHERIYPNDPMLPVAARDTDEETRESDIDLVWGLGARWHFTQRWAIFLDYTRMDYAIDVDGPTKADAKLDAIMFGFNAEFF